MAGPMKDVDPAFQGIGSHKAGIDIWRVEAFKVVSVPKDNYGKFYTGDSYIILKTSALKSGGYSYAIHFWLGKETSPDEAGVAAIKAVELDAALGGKAVQYREVQGHESDLLLSYFRPCIIALPGGVASGFRKAGADAAAPFENRLFQCKGKRFVRVRQVPVARGSLSHSDIYILETADKLFQFNGANASKAEKGKALEVTQALKDSPDHHGRCAVAIIEDGKLDDEESGEFWGHFGGYAPIAKKGTSEDDIDAKPTPPKLISVGSGGSRDSSSPGGALKKSQLEAGKCYLLDCGSEVFVWLGRISPLEDRRAASAAAEDLIRKEKRPPSTRVARVVERFETPAFKAHFDEWPVVPAMATDSSNSKLKAMLRQSGVVDVKGASTKAAGAASAGDTAGPPLADPSGKIEVWRVEGSEKKPVGAAEAGRFYSGDCYVVQYTLMRDRKSEHLVFFWLGRSSTPQDKGAAAALASKLHSSLRNSSLLARVVQGKEPPQFLSLFKGHLLFFRGGLGSGYKQAVGATDDTYTLEAIALFKVRPGPGSGQQEDASTVLVSQVDPVAGSLNSADCYVLQTSSSVFIWVGQHSSDADKAAATTAVELLKPGVAAKTAVEGKEPSTFWMHIGGKGEYASQRESRDVARDARLFACSNLASSLKLSEVYNYTQDDLLAEEVMMLDVFSEIYAWVGAHASDSEKKGAFDVAQRYLDLVVSSEGRSRDTTLIKVIEGQEPAMFTAHFASWDNTKSATFVDPYERKLAVLLGRSTPTSEAGRRKFGGPQPPATPDRTAPAPSSPSPAASAAAAAGPAAPSGEPESAPPSASSQMKAALAALSSSIPSIVAPKTSTPSPARAPLPAAPAPEEPESLPSPTPSSQRAAAIAALSGQLRGEKNAAPRGQPTPAASKLAPPPAPAEAAPASEPEPEAEPASEAVASKPSSEPELPAAEAEPEEAAAPEAEPVPEPAPVPAPAAAETTAPEEGTFPYERLKRDSSDPAPGIDSTKRETYLGSAEFEKLFGMPKEQFQALPKWKKDQKKTLLDLF